MKRPIRTNDRAALLFLLRSEEPTEDEFQLVYDTQQDVNLLAGTDQQVAVNSLGPIPTQTGTKASSDPTDQD
jgi:hypothetical protein